MGLANSFSSLGRMVGPIWAGFLFDASYNLPFVSGAAILFAGFLISLRWVKQEPAAPSPIKKTLRVFRNPSPFSTPAGIQLQAA
jgi:MFS family permease